MDQKTAGVLPANLPFTTDVWTEYQTRRPLFLAELQEYRNSNAAQKLTTDATTAASANLYLHVSHYLQVLNMAVERKVFPAAVRSFYGLDINSVALPSLKSEAELTTWGANIATGEAARVAAGGAPLAFPTAAEVATALATYNTAQQAQANAKLATNKELADVAVIFPAMVAAIMDLYDELEFANRKQSPGYIRNILREYGMQFRNDVDEATVLDITVEPGSNYVVNEVALGDNTVVEATVLTEGGSVTMCRNVATGCEVSGIALIYNEKVTATSAELVGIDANVVFTNLSATPVQVRVRIVG